MTNYRSLNHSKWACQYHVVLIPKYRKKAIYGSLRRYLGGVLRALARHAGVHLYIETEDIVWACRDLLAISVNVISVM